MDPFHATEPHAAFASWFAEAKASEPDVPDAIQIASVADGVPSIRTVLLKGWGEDGWVFYTNLGSQKGSELVHNGAVAGVLHWKSLQRQVRVVGTASLVEEEVADAYFASRPRGSQLGAWASRQSEVLDERATLVNRLAEITGRFEGQPVPRPPFWSGFRIALSQIEFWQGRADRLHDRVRFTALGGEWTRERLYP